MHQVDDRPAELPAISDIRPDEWKRLAQRRVFFGHHSVGRNLLAGVREILAENPAIRLELLETADPERMTAPALYHAPVGRNHDPRSKLADFSRIVGDGLGNDGIALLKFCYVDVTRETDAAALFAEYREAIDTLQARHPALTIIHVTIPLQVDPGTLFHWRTIVRGKHTPLRTLNAVRMRYNRLLRSAYEGDEPVFDLAHVEATRRDGSAARARMGRDDVPFLAPEWTDDGGHLNEAGRRRLAEAFLASLARARPA